jgi:FdrA protein
MSVWNFVRRSAYQDSVTLMRLTGELEAIPGVRRAAVMMGTRENKDLLDAAGLLATDGRDAAPADLVIAVAADDDAAAHGAREAVERALTARRGNGAGAIARPRTLGSALGTLAGANLAIISVPGRYAAVEARRALQAGLHVMLFSDHVPVDTEVELKRLALSRGRLMMGPDCGTAIIDGTTLGFANAVPRGRIGVVAASGTGCQEFTVLVANAGEGISQAIGLGGRDLTDAVGGMMALRALELLDEDPETAVLALIGKPPGPATTKALAARVAALRTPCIVHFAGAPAPQFGCSADTLEDVAQAAVALARGDRPVAIEFAAPDEARRAAATAQRALQPGQRFVRGVYSGGTLAYEALGILKARLANVAPSVLGDGAGHRVVDLGDDRFTLGRPHPMLDGSLRREWIAREAADPATAVLLLDLVLGYGAHADPGADLAAAVVAARAAQRGLAVVASVTGTDADPQNRTRQVRALTEAGAVVMPSNAQAARLAALIADR